MTADPSVQTSLIESPQYRPRMIQFGVVPGAAQEETVTLPATAGATQGDFIVIKNQAGESEALWLDIDADGTQPTAAAFLAADVQTIVSISTGNSAAQVGAIFEAAITLADVTVVDNTDGTVTITQDVYGDCDDAVVSNASGSGAGSIAAVVDVDGLDASMGNGKFDGTIAQTSEGVFSITFKQAFLRAPEVVATAKTTDGIARVVDSQVGSISIEMQALSTGAPVDVPCSIMVLGSDAKDAILNM